MADDKAKSKGAEKLDRRDPEAALGPANPEPEERTAKEPTDEEMSPADLELSLTAATGEPIIVKSNPETPSLQQIDAATSVVAGPAITTVVVTDAEGNEVESTLTPDNAALISQRAASTNPDHLAHNQMGWSNPNLKEMTDEEREEDQKEYDKRAGRKTKTPAKAGATS